MSLGMDDGSLQGGEYCNGVATKRKGMRLRRPDFCVSRGESIKLSPQEMSWRLCEHWRWLGKGEETQCSCAQG